MNDKKQLKNYILYDSRKGLMHDEIIKGNSPMDAVRRKYGNTMVRLTGENARYGEISVCEVKYNEETKGFYYPRGSKMLYYTTKEKSDRMNIVNL